MTTRTKPICITGSRILPLGSDDSIIENVDLWIADGLIHSLLPTGAPNPTGLEHEKLQFDNAVVIPGLVNAHSHSGSATRRGQIPGDHLDLFLIEGMALRDRRTPREIRLVALYHAMEMIKSGVTGAIDHFRHGLLPNPEAVLALLSAYEEIGLRVAVAPMFEDTTYIDTLPLDRTALPKGHQSRWEGAPAEPDDYFAALEAILSAWKGHGLAKLMLGVEGPQRCSQRLLEMTGAFAAQYNIGLHSHILESKTHAMMAAEECGKSQLRQLDEYGLVSPLSSFAHFVWGNDEDIALAAERKVNIVHNPVSNLVLGSGLQPTSRLLAAGVPVALGNDGSSTSGVSLFQQAKFAALLSRISNPDPDSWIMPAQALRMATNGGARTLNIGPDAGSIVPGAPADVTVVDLSGRAHRPLGDVRTHLVMYENGDGVDTVIVAGRIIMRNRRIALVDEEEIYREVEAIAREENLLNASVRQRAKEERPEYRDMIVGALRQDIGFSRYADLD
jgi:cytosine/adenosine deaminase-related metal-dependent hydrolase